MSDAPHSQRAIERLAREAQVPVNEVARLYEEARARLAAGARIKSFIGIFALRSVRKLLRPRGAGALALPLLAIALAGWTDAAHGGPFSASGRVIAILGGELFVGEARARPTGSGTIALRSRSSPELTCAGEFSATAALGDAGRLGCSDGAAATFQFRRLGLRRGYGEGTSSRGPLSFTYGLSAEDAAPYLKLPAGKELRRNGGDLDLVAAVPLPSLK